MKTAVAALTARGCELALKIGPKLNADVFIRNYSDEGNIIRFGDTPAIKRLPEDFGEFVGQIFETYDALVFIMACGIAVRSIAPYIKHKTIDPAVVVLDEAGEFCISLLSGHIGGANNLAAEIAAITGGTPVITTSTDINRVTAFDLLAADNECIIENINDLKFISSQLVNGGKVGLQSDIPVKGRLPENILFEDNEGYEKLNFTVAVTSRLIKPEDGKKTLLLRPKNLVLGIGCRRGISKDDIAAAIGDFLDKNKRSMLSLNSIATIDLKKDEQGLQDYCREIGVPLKIIPRERIKSIEDRFSTSDFVKEKIGVASVAEPCSVLAGNNAALICEKSKYKGITLALAEEEKVFRI